MQSVFLHKELLKGDKQRERALSAVNVGSAPEGELQEPFSPAMQALVEVSSVSQDYAGAWKCVQERSPSALREGDGCSCVSFVWRYQDRGRIPHRKHMVRNGLCLGGCTLSGMVHGRR